MSHHLRPRALGPLLLLLTVTAPRPAFSQEAVQLIAPETRGNAGNLSRELLFNLTRVLAQHPRYTRAGDGPLLPDEAMASLDCQRLDALCAARVGEVADVQVVLTSSIERAPDRVTIRLVLVDVQSASARRVLRRDVRVATGRPFNDTLVYPVLAWLAGRLFSGAPPRADDGAIAVRAPGDARISIDGLDQQPGEVLEIEAGTHEVVVDRRHGAESRRVRVGRGELVLLDAEGAALAGGSGDRASGQRVAAWISLGVGVASLAAAGFTAMLMSRKQEQFDEHPTEDLLAQGNGLARTANGLIIAGGLSIALSGYLFWE